MNLDEYYRNRGHGISLQEIYKNTLSKASDYSEKITEEDCKILQEYLQEIFYGTQEDGAYNNIRHYVFQMVQAAFQQTYQEKLQSFSMNKYSISQSIEDIPLIIREKYEAFSHKNKIERQTIETRLKKVQQMQNDLSMKNLSSQTLKNMKDEADKLEQLLLELLQEITENSNTLIIKGNDNLIKKVNIADGIFMGLSAAQELTPKQIGDILEYALQTASGEAYKIGEELGSEMIKNFIKQIAGSKRTESGGVLKFDTKVVSSLEKTNVIKSDEEEKIKMVIGDLSFEYTKQINYNSSRQGKMDVNFTLPEAYGGKKFRISAKNWASVKTGDFGETNLLYALLRTIDIENADFVLFTGADKDYENNGYKVAWVERIIKLSAIVDILMGLSQEADFADTIVINDRSKSQIIVKSMYSIIKMLEKEIDKIPLQGYSKFEREQMVNIRNYFMKHYQSGEGRSEMIKYALYKYLQSIKITLTAAAVGIK